MAMVWRTPRRRTLIGIGCVCALVVCISPMANSQSHVVTGAESSSPLPIPVETFKEPRFKSGSLTNFYPPDEIRKDGEGWVTLSLMVDSKGKPYEVAVDDSTGNKAFDDAAVAAVSRFTFEPGTVNGQPVDSVSHYRIRFTLPDIPRTVYRDFLGFYLAAQAAIKVKDRSAADAAIKMLEIRNLTEDAYYGLIKYDYARVWGDDREQLADLRRAIASAEIPDYLPKGVYGSVLDECLVLELKLHDFVEALRTWDRLQKLNGNDKARVQMKPIFADLEKLRTDDRAYDVAGVLSDDSWYLNLLKRHFRIAVSDGYIAHVKLLCTKRFVSFPFDPKEQYQADDAWGDCALRLEGKAGTHFTLSQS